MKFPLHFALGLANLMIFPDVHCTGADRGSTRLGAFTGSAVVLWA